MKLRRIPALAGLLFAACLPVAQAADLFQFDDATENLRVLLNGQPLAGNITNLITNLTFTTVLEPGGGQGEVVYFDYTPAHPGPLDLHDGSGAPQNYVYTQSWEPGLAGAQIVSDEFHIVLNGPGVYRVTFASADQDWIRQNFPSPLTPSALSAFEQPFYQDVGYLHESPAPGARFATFQVLSVPEPASYLMFAAGLVVLGLARRPRQTA